MAFYLKSLFTHNLYKITLTAVVFVVSVSTISYIYTHSMQFGWAARFDARPYTGNAILYHPGHQQNLNRWRAQLAKQFSHALMAQGLAAPTAAPQVRVRVIDVLAGAADVGFQLAKLPLQYKLYPYTFPNSLWARVPVDDIWVHRLPAHSVRVFNHYTWECVTKTVLSNEVPVYLCKGLDPKIETMSGSLHSLYALRQLV